jgi:hypothetical protein
LTIDEIKALSGRELDEAVAQWMEPNPEPPLQGGSGKWTTSPGGWWRWDHFTRRWEAVDLRSVIPGSVKDDVLAEVEKRNLIEPFLAWLDILQYGRPLPFGMPWSAQQKWTYLTVDPASICRAALMTEVADAK